MSAVPGSAVLGAFGLDDAMPSPLEGGTGRSWRVGDVVLKPLDMRPEQLAWQAELSESARHAYFGFGRCVSAMTLPSGSL